MATYGITGGNGFIGTWVQKELAARGHSVLIFDHLGRSQTPDDIFMGDVRDETDVFEFAAHVDGIIHLAAVLGTQETIQNPIPSAEINIIGSLNVFEAAVRYNLPVAYAGVGNHFMRLSGAGSYTISKSASEDYARMFNMYRGGRIAIVRPVNAYGPGQSISAPFGPSKVRKIMPSMICRALTGNPIEIYGDGQQVSDCVYVKDVARTFVNALECVSELSSAKGLKPIECGPNESHTVKEIARLIAGEVALVTGKEVVGIDHLDMRPGETPNAIVSANTGTLFQIGIDVSNFISLQKGIALTVEYYRKNWLPEYLESS